MLPEVGPGSGKGNALWKSLHACRGDLLCWLDADLRNFRADAVTRLVEPLLADSDTVLVKASYARSFEGAPTGGGRVTELVARPLLSLLFPKLADIVQPLGGEYAARRDALEVLPFVEGWGVELGLLVDVVERFGRDAVTQVDLGTPSTATVPSTSSRRSRSRSSRRHCDAPTSCTSTEPALELLRYDLAGNLDVEQVEIRERPPISAIAAYRARHLQDGRAGAECAVPTGAPGAGGGGGRGGAGGRRGGEP